MLRARPDELVGSTGFWRHKRAQMKISTGQWGGGKTRARGQERTESKPLEDLRLTKTFPKMGEKERGPRSVREAKVQTRKKGSVCVNKYTRVL